MLKIGSDNRIYEVPLEGVQPIIDYVPRRGDAILFNYTNGDEIEGIILDFGYRKDDYALFVMIKEQPDYADYSFCLLYTSDAADDLLCVDLGGRRIITKKKKQTHRPYYKISSIT